VPGAERIGQDAAVLARAAAVAKRGRGAPLGELVAVVADQQQSAGGLKGAKPREQPRADIPKEFGFLFQSPEQRTQEAAKRPTYWEDLWKGLPYDSISLERGSTGGCVGACEVSSTVTLYRATVSGIVVGPLDRSGRMVFGELRGRAELRTVTVGTPFIPGALPSEQPPGPRISDLEGSIDIYTFANLSYLLHRAGFLQLPDRYDCRDCAAGRCSSCPADRPYVILSVAAGGKTKTVIDYVYGYGDARLVELWAIQQALDSVSKSIKWTQK